MKVVFTLALARWFTADVERVPRVPREVWTAGLSVGIHALFGVLVLLPVLAPARAPEEVEWSFIPPKPPLPVQPAAPAAEPQAEAAPAAAPRARHVRRRPTLTTALPTVAPGATAASGVAVAVAPSPAPPTPLHTVAAPSQGDLRGYLGAISSAVIARRRYPALALQLRLEGNVKISVRIARDGRLIGPPSVARSSGHEILDKEAMRMVAAAAPFPPLPSSYQAPTAELRIPVRFHLDL